MSIDVCYFTPDGNLREDLDEDSISEVYKSREGLLWVDITGVSEDEGAYIARNFMFHPLSIEDCVSENIHPPKIDDFRSYLFVIVHGVNHSVETEIVQTAELAFFLGNNFIVSTHTFPLYSINAVQQLIREDSRIMLRGADSLAYTIIDVLVDNVMPTIDSMSDTAEAIEEEVVLQPRKETLEAIIKLKRSTLRVHRVMAPQREVLNRLSRGEFPIIQAEHQIYYRDVYDHVMRIEDLNQTIRDRADNALSTYLSSIANRQNETMRVLSIVATIFLPLTLLAGIYGMNFEYMPELSWRWGYFAVLGIIGFVILVLIWRFWVAGWFAWGRKRMSWVKPFMVDYRRIRGFFTAGNKGVNRSQGK